MALMGLLATLFFPLIEKMRTRAERVVCISNLRSIHVSLGSYLTDNKTWPQMPPGLIIEQHPEFWTDALEDYGANRRVWLCPSLTRILKDDRENAGKHPRIHYIPGRFGPHPSEPLKYPKQPWALEISAIHGDGNMVIQANGEVHSLNKLLRDNGLAPVGDSSGL